MSDEDHLLEREEVDLLTNNESSEEKDEAATDHKPEMKGSGRRSEDLTYTVEEAVEKLGFGPFQLIVTVFSGLLWIADSMEIMLLSILSPAVKCQWNLTPAEEAIITSVIFLGAIFGSLFWGIVCDKIGRKMGLLAIDVLVLVFGVSSAIQLTPGDEKVPGYAWVVMCRFGVGFSGSGAVNAVTYYSEFLPKKARGFCLTIQAMWWVFGTMFGAALAVAVMPTLGWHWYLGLAATPLALVLPLFLFVPESARFYVVHGKPEKAEKVIRRIAWFNRRDPPKGRIVSVDEQERLQAKYKKEPISERVLFINGEVIISDTPQSGPEIESEPEIEAGPLLSSTPAEVEQSTKSKCWSRVISMIKEKSLLHLKFLRILFVKKMWQTTLPLLVMWFGNSMVYIGIVLLTTTLIQNNPHCGIIQNATNKTCEQLTLTTKDYIKILWAAAAELPGLILTVLIIECLGRKKTMAVEFTACMGSFLLLFICAGPNVTNLFLFLVRAFNAGVTQALTVYTPEVYPTSVRATSLGVLSAAARMGGMAAPFVAQVLFRVNDYATFTLFATTCLVLALLALLLPIETKGRSMKDEGIPK